jgi:hypothetical protein
MMKGREIRSPDSKKGEQVASNNISTVDLRNTQYLGFNLSQSTFQPSYMESSADLNAPLGRRRFIEVNEAETFSTKLFLDLKSGKIKNALN